MGKMHQVTHVLQAAGYTYLTSRVVHSRQTDSSMTEYSNFNYDYYMRQQY